ncbi:MAG: hypothetical protein ACK52I_00905 [Pseudomonadota bacterium]|jgi:hypothetical protein
MTAVFTNSKVTFDVGSFVVTILGTDMTRVWYELKREGDQNYYVVYVARKSADTFQLDLRSGIENQKGWTNDLFGAKQCVDDISAIAGECCNPFDGLIVQGIQGIQGAQGVQGTIGTGGALGYYGVFYDITDQTAAVANTGYPMKLGTTAEANGISITNNGLGQPTQITFANAGTYDIQFSAQFANSHSAEEVIDIWFKKNNVNVPDSDSQITIPKRQSGVDGYALPAWNYMATFTAGDVLEIYWAVTDTRVSMHHEVANAVHPAIPSVIVTVAQVMYTQAGPQGTQGIQGIQGVQGIQGTTAAQGATGIQGFTGAQGLQGPQGTDGLIGATGPQGTQGLQGLTGATGATGAQGTQGLQGLTGSTGATGAQGTQGLQGTTGITGPTGLQGTQGIQGTSGAVYTSTDLNYTGGNQATTSTSVANVHTSAAFTGIASGRYTFEFAITYNAAATSTGSLFVLQGANGTYLTYTTNYQTLAADGSSTAVIGLSPAAIATASSRATTNNYAIVQGNFYSSGSGSLTLQFATEVAGSAITATAIVGWIRQYQ